MESIKDRCKFVVDKSKCIKCGKCMFWYGITIWKRWLPRNERL